jgi:4-amino-4-deoxy-L-arabinose transferase-like glycosyltransferase
VALVLITPVFWFGRRRLPDLLSPRVACVFLAVAAPWYVLCYARNGWPFIEEFFLKHHFGRFSDDVLQHAQPFWFFVPVLVATLLPWTPLAALALRRKLYADVRLRLLAAVCGFGLLFFSASTNKLPAYVLPLVPPIAALAGAGLAATRRAPLLLSVCGMLLAAWPVGSSILPLAVARGLSRADPPPLDWTWLAPPVLAVLIFVLERRGLRGRAVAVLAAGSAAGVILLKISAFPVLDREVSARSLWRRIEACREEICIERLHRALRYGLNYYADEPLPSCAEEDRPVRLDTEWIPASFSCGNRLTRLPPPLYSRDSAP